jgi:hypothetical protein
MSYLVSYLLSLCRKPKTVEYFQGLDLNDLGKILILTVDV